MNSESGWPPLGIAAAGVILFLAMDFAVRFGAEARRVDQAPSDRGTTRGAYLAFITIVFAVFALPLRLPPGFAAFPLARPLRRPLPRIRPGGRGAVPVRAARAAGLISGGGRGRRTAAAGTNRV